MPNDVEQIGERIVSAYGRDGLRLLDRATILQAGIDRSDADLLSNIGVPREEQLQISFNLIDELPSLNHVAERKAGALHDWSRDIVCLNEKYCIVLGVDKRSSGQVVAIDLKGKLPEHYVNSRVRYLVGFMAECVLHWRRWTQEGVSNEQSLEMARLWMNDTDREALREGTWWTLVLEQMRVGLL